MPLLEKNHEYDAGLAQAEGASVLTTYWAPTHLEMSVAGGRLQLFNPASTLCWRVPTPCRPSYVRCCKWLAQRLTRKVAPPCCVSLLRSERSGRQRLHGDRVGLLAWRLDLPPRLRHGPVAGHEHPDLALPDAAAGTERNDAWHLVFFLNPTLLLGGGMSPTNRLITLVTVPSNYLQPKTIIPSH